MLKKILINCFLIAWLLVLGIDAAPDIGDWHRKLKLSLDPILDVTGLWQGNWNLFAPEPDKLNVAIIADISFPDGQEVTWRSPDWRSMSIWEKFLRFREAEFIDNVHKNQFTCAWSSFADYLTRTNLHPNHPEMKPTRIILTREWATIPPPNPDNVSQFPELPEMDRNYIFIAKEYQP